MKTDTRVVYTMDLYWLFLFYGIGKLFSLSDIREDFQANRLTSRYTQYICTNITQLILSTDNFFVCKGQR